MKRIAFASFFLLSYAGTVFSACCLLFGLLPVVRLVIFVFSLSGLACLGMKEGRNGLYRLPGLVLSSFGVVFLLYSLLHLFDINTLFRGILLIIYGVWLLMIGILVSNHL